MHPREPLIAAPEVGPQKHPENRDDFSQHPAAAPHHDAEAAQHDPDAMFCRLDGLGLPFPGKHGEKIRPRRRLFGELLVFVIAIVARAGGAEEVCLFALSRRHGFHEVPRGEDAALPDDSFRLVGPSGEDRGAGKVDEGLVLRDPLLPGPPDRGVPLQGDCARRKTDPGLDLAHEHRHRVPLRRQFAGKRRPHKPRAAGHQNLHMPHSVRGPGSQAYRITGKKIS